MKRSSMRLQHRDGILIHGELALLPNVICTKRGFDITVLYEALLTPESNTESGTHGLNCKAVVDIWQDKMAMAEHTFNVNSCGCGTNNSAHKINAGRLSMHWELRGSCEPCVINAEILHVSHAATGAHP